MKEIIDWFLKQKRIVKALILTVAYFGGLGVFCVFLLLGGLIAGEFGVGIMATCMAFGLIVIINYFCLDD